MARRTIDLDTVQPNGKRGETQRPAFTKVNENFADLYTDLDELETTVQDLRRRQNGRNRLINGDFRFWQRGSSRTVVSPLAVYVPDRFQVVCTGAGQVAVSRRSFDAPAFGVTGFMNCDLTGSTAATEAFVTQPVEGVQTLAGSTVTLSMQAWAATPGCRIGVRFIQTFGTNGSPDVTVRAGVQEIGTAAALRYFTVELPSIAGKTVGANSKLHVIVDFATPGGYGGQLVGQSGSFSLTCMQLEKGATPTDYDMRDDATELMLCQRYYEKSFPLEQAPQLGMPSPQGVAAAFQAGLARSEQISFKVAKRTVPALTLYSNSEVAPALGYWSLFNGNGWSRGMAVPLFLRPDGFTLQLDFGSGLTPFYAYPVGGNWAADAEI